MGLLRLGGGSLLLLVSALIVGFAVAVNTSSKVNRFYESNVKENLEWGEFLVSWTDAMCYVLPLVTFAIIKKWDAVFYDCFTPITIWLDSGYSICLLVQLLCFIGDYPKNYVKISVEWLGLGIQMSSIFSYVMLKSSLDANFISNEVKRQNLCALLFFGVSSFFLILVLDAKGDKVLPAAGKGFKTIAMLVAVAAMGCQLAQIYSAIYYRYKAKDFNDDSPDIAMVKLVAAVIKVVTQCYYCWLYTSKGFWNSDEKLPLALMTSFSLGYFVLVTLERFVGPSWLKGAYDRIVAKTWAAWHRMAACYNGMVDEVGRGITRDFAAMRQWWAEERESMKGRWTALSGACKATVNSLRGRQVAGCIVAAM